MKLRKNIGVFLIILFFSNILYSRTIEVWPGASRLGYYKIAQKTYNGSLNSIYVDNKAYPLQTDLTHRFVKMNLMSRTIDLTNKYIQTAMYDIENTNTWYEALKDPMDPYKALVEIFVSKSNNSKTQELKEEILEKIFNQIGEIIIEFAKESKGDYAKAISLGLLTKINTIIISNTVLEDYPLAQFIISKGIEVSLEALYEYGVNGNLKYLTENIAKNTLSSALAFLDVANNAVNLLSLTYTINSINNTTKKLLIADLITNFMFDYIYKYNMNIEKMAKDSWVLYNGRKIEPYFFNRVFIFYLMTHNRTGRVNYENSYLGLTKIENSNGGIISNIIGALLNLNEIELDYKDPDDLKLLTLAARDVLNLIERYGNGGNKMIVLDIDKDVEVNERSYHIYSYYWMPEGDFLLENNEWCAKNFLYCSSGINSSIITPFEQSVTDKNGNKVFYIVNKKKSREHVDVNLSDLKKTNLFYFGTLEKVINYKGFAKEPHDDISESDYKLRLYNEKSVMEYENFYALRYYKILPDVSSNIKKLLAYFLKKGVLDVYDVINFRYMLTHKLTLEEFEILLEKYIKTANTSRKIKLSMRDIREAIKSLEENRFKRFKRLTRRDAFYVFSYLLSKFDFEGVKRCGYLELPFSKCMLLRNSISSGSDLNSTLSFYQAVAMLYKFDIVYKGGKK